MTELPAQTNQKVDPSQTDRRLVRPQDDNDGPRLIYEPFIRPNGQACYEIRGELEDKNVIAWGFWGGLLVAFVAITLLFSAQNVYNVWDILWAIVAIAVGLFLYRYGKRSSLREEVLCTVDMQREALAWPSHSADGPELVLPFDEITEVVFGMTNYPVSQQRKDVQVHAFTLLVRDEQDRLIPIVEATPNKGDAHTIAKILANELQLGITYVGAGIR